MNSQQLLALVLAGLVSTLATACSNPIVDDDDTTGDDDDSVSDDDDSAGDDTTVGDDDDTTPTIDEDGDGHAPLAAGGLDCDDSDPTVNPTSYEICDGIDNNCDDEIDNEAIDSLVWNLDADSDGYGGQLLTQESCSAPASYVENADDCDDLVSSIYPGATELCNGIDDDCDGDIDDDAPAAQVWYLDNDGDGVGGLWLTQDACDMPLGYAPDSDDCDDTNAAIYPSAPELCDGLDNDCDGNLGSDEIDDDSDGVTECNLDCDDADPLRFPGSVELCDGIDNDCDTATTAAGGEIDADSDTSLSCEDCDDDPSTGPGINPSATEVCDGIDNDCDGTIDVGATNVSTWYLDADGDTYGGGWLTQQSCTAPTGYVATSDDCNDLDPTSYPGATELCDGIDNDCNTLIDDGSGATGTIWYSDTDGDGYGDQGTSITACVQPTNFVTNSLDCDDGNAATNPSSYEVCDGVDNNCANGIDEAGALNAALWYVDADGDGYGRLSITLSACDQPTGYADNAADCDDDDGANAPNGPELCDGQDNDCNGAADFDATGEVDLDSDGSPSCADCDDNDSANTPGGTELCDGQDNDCIGGADLDVDGEVDGDADGSLSCADCDDDDSANVPGGTEVCDGQDNDCSAGADFDTDGEVDADSDGSLSCADCDDDPATGGDRYPGNSEVCGDGVDQDCSGVDLSCFSTVVFTSCGNTGRTGPSQAECDAAYAGTSLAGAVTVSNGIQQWTVPVTDTFTVEALGAQGGSVGSYTGGLGAKMQGDSVLQAGATLHIIVGQIGIGAGQGAGGGGGTYVVRNPGTSTSDIVIIAGGGGGATSYSNTNGASGLTGTEGGASNSTGNGIGTGSMGGANGSGGGSGCAAGGGGFSSDGDLGAHQALGGSSFQNGSDGGLAQDGNSGQNAHGGFGGGGAGSWGNGYGGGGGGYSGGGGGSWNNSVAGHGGGGGSFNSGTNQDNQAGVNNDQGEITISVAN